MFKVSMKKTGFRELVYFFSAQAVARQFSERLQRHNTAIVDELIITPETCYTAMEVEKAVGRATEYFAHSTSYNEVKMSKYNVLVLKHTEGGTTIADMVAIDAYAIETMASPLELQQRLDNQEYEKHGFDVRVYLQPYEL